ncbi:uncharacterized protein LOC141609489 [Silene latifolia]|uniref:uncharacterized protein LOC141609489 n=1 Tax=Silene latifolia TaxID=37657 RepID=UPI003D77D30A
MENICSKEREWTNQSHSNFLSLMEESFVKTMFQKNYVYSKSSNNIKTGINNTRLDRFVPDMAESTLDLGSRKSVTKAAMRVLGAVTTTRSTQRQRLRRFHPYKVTHDQVVPELEGKAGDKGDN